MGQFLKSPFSLETMKSVLKLRKYFPKRKIGTAETVIQSFALS